jgi:ABC-2 type transport system permease protein
MSIVMSYFKADLLSFVRNYNALFSTALFPPLLFLLFGPKGGGSVVEQITMLAAFTNYAVQSVAFMSLAMEISSARHSVWSLYLRTLPVAPYKRFLGMLMAILVRAIIGLLLVLIVAYLAGRITLPLSTLFFIAVIALLGVIPMGLLGIACGNLLDPASARPFLVVTNLLLFFGSFSLPSQGIPGYLRNFIPSYQWLALVINHYIPQASVMIPWLWMAGFMLFFYFLAVWSYVRQRSMRLS